MDPRANAFVTREKGAVFLVDRADPKSRLDGTMGFGKSGEGAELRRVGGTVGTREVVFRDSSVAQESASIKRPSERA